jgi:hypothetical protein
LVARPNALGTSSQPDPRLLDPVFSQTQIFSILFFCLCRFFFFFLIYFFHTVKKNKLMRLFILYKSWVMIIFFHLRLSWINFFSLSIGSCWLFSYLTNLIFYLCKFVYLFSYFFSYGKEKINWLDFFILYKSWVIIISFHLRLDLVEFLFS